MWNSKASKDSPSDRFKSSERVLQMLADELHEGGNNTKQAPKKASLLQKIDTSLAALEEEANVLRSLVDTHVKPMQELDIHGHNTFGIWLLYDESRSINEEVAKKVEQLKINTPAGQNDSEIAMLTKLLLKMDAFWDIHFHAVKNSTLSRGYNTEEIILQQDDALRIIGAFMPIQRKTFIQFQLLEGYRANCVENFGELTNEKADTLNSVQGLVPQLTNALKGLIEEAKEPAHDPSNDPSLNLAETQHIPDGDPFKISLIEFKKVALQYYKAAAEKSLPWEQMMQAMTNFATCIKYCDSITDLANDFQSKRQNTKEIDIEEYCLQGMVKVRKLVKEIPLAKRSITVLFTTEDVLALSLEMVDRLQSLEIHTMSILETVLIKHSQQHYDEIMERIGDGDPSVIAQFGGSSLDPKDPKSVLSVESTIRMKANNENFQQSAKLQCKSVALKSGTLTAPPVKTDIYASRTKLTQLRVAIFQEKPLEQAPLPSTGKKRSRDQETLNFKTKIQRVIGLGVVGVAMTVVPIFY